MGRYRVLICALLQIALLVFLTYIFLWSYASLCYPLYSKFGILVGFYSVLEVIVTLPMLLMLRPLVLPVFMILFSGAIVGIFLSNSHECFSCGTLAGVLVGVLLIVGEFILLNVNLLIVLTVDLFAVSSDRVVYYGVYMISVKKFILSVIVFYASTIPSIFSMRLIRKMKERMSKREEKSEKLIILRCPNCGAEFFSMPICCAYCGNIIKNE
ncbi:MAG: hypothetical protein J7L07_05040 [Candidatus Odinarchaeota archaeon]|nr:hypothetical protein [Candidatus Odinarchaeota archaeon]